MSCSAKQDIKINPERHVGIEIEFNGLPIERVSTLVAEIIEGDISRQHDYRHRIKSEKYGEFLIEVDYALLQKMAEDSLEKGSQSTEAMMLELLSPIAMPLAPLEVVTPPLLPEHFPIYESIIRELRNAGAKGTGQSAFYAFGLHINIEAPDLEAKTILAYLQSFCLLYDWLKGKMEIDLSRQISNYISGYKSSYASHILRPDYGPDQRELMQDYLNFHPGRNYALDMLPLFAEIDAEWLSQQLDAPLNKPRPAFHFRMPNCRIDEPDWRFETEWKHWESIEKLAQDDALRSDLIDQFQQNEARLMHYIDNQWVDKMEQIFG
jgi:hypothetical protein